MTLLDLYARADDMQRAADKARNSGGEYALEEVQAMIANDAFWDNLAAETGITRKMMERRL